MNLQVGGQLYKLTTIQTWFPSSLAEIRVPFFLLFGFNKGAQKENKGKRVLLGNLAERRVNMRLCHRGLLKASKVPLLTVRGTSLARVLVKGCSLSCHSNQTILVTKVPYSGNLN